MSSPAIPSDPLELWHALWEADYAADPFLRSLRTTYWVMNLDWYKAVRRAYLPPDAGDDARDETKWAPGPGDMVLGRTITVTENGGEPHLVDGLGHLFAVEARD